MKIVAFKNNPDSTFAHIFFSSLKSWLFVFVGILLPLDLIFRLHSFMLASSVDKIILDVALLIVYFSVIALAISLIFAIIAAGLGLLSERFPPIIGSLSLCLSIGLASFILCKNFIRWIKGFVPIGWLPISPEGRIAANLLLISVMLVILIIGMFKKQLLFNIMIEKISSAFKPLLLVVAGALVLSIVRLHYYPILFNPNGPVGLTTRGNFPKPHIILITFDALSARDMSLYAYSRKTTPQIDSFAKDSFIFDNMVANSNWTGSGTMSILSGKQVCHHKIYHTIYSYSILNQKNDKENLSHILKEYYNTIIITQNIYAHPNYLGTINSFHYTYYVPSNDDELETWSANILYPLNGLSLMRWLTFIKNDYFLRPVLLYFWQNYSSNHNGSPFTTAKSAFTQALNLLSKSNRPCFLWVHLIPPHAPYLPRKPFLFTFSKGDPVKREKMFLGGAYPPELQEVVNHQRACYDEYILNVDADFGEFLERIKERGVWDNSIIIVSADHGESFVKGFQGHGLSFLYQPVLHIPLIIHLPHQQMGKRIASLAQQADLAPTILDLLGLEVPSWMNGESLKAAMLDDYMSHRPKFSMALERNSRFKPIITGVIAVFRGDSKYIYDVKKNSGELYNLKNDPGEHNDLAVRDPRKAKEMQTIILQKIIRPSG